MNKEQLAIHGGTPVRTGGFPPITAGASVIGPEELAELKDVVDERSPFRHYGIGKSVKTKQLEDDARAMLGSRHTLALSSGTSALSCALTAMNIGIGHEVIMPAFGWYSDFNAVVLAGALPVFAEVDDTLNLCPIDLEKKITPQTKAVIVIHYQGVPARMDEIMSVARKHGIQVIEDVAQAFGGEYRGQKLGTIGDIAITSFQGNKLLTCGEGGMLYTDSDRYFVRAVRYHDLGQFRPAFVPYLEDPSIVEQEPGFAGHQMRMSELQSAFLLAQLRKLPSILERCRANYRKLEAALGSSPNYSLRPVEDGHCGITLFLRFKTADEAEAFNKTLTAEGLYCGASSACFPLPQREPVSNKGLPTQGLPPFGEGFNGEHVSYEMETTCPQTVAMLSCYTGIGLGPLYTDQDIDDIIYAIQKVEQGLYA